MYIVFNLELGCECEIRYLFISNIFNFLKSFFMYLESLKCCILVYKPIWILNISALDALAGYLC